MRGQMQQLFRCYVVGVDGADSKHTLRQCAGLVKYHGSDLSKRFQIVAALDEYAAARRAADAAEECQRYRYDQRTRAGNDQKCQCTSQPNCKLPAEISGKQRRYK